MSQPTRYRKTAGVTALFLALLSFGVFGSTSTTFASGGITVDGKAVVTNTGGDNIRVRSGAGSQNDQIAEAHEGETVTILAGPTKDKKGNAWYKVQAPGGTGWIISDFLAAKSSGSTSSSFRHLTGKATIANTGGDTVRVRSGPGTENDQVAEAHQGESVTVLAGPSKDSNGDSWYKVQAPGGTGWVRVDFLSGTYASSSSSASSTSSSKSMGTSSAQARTASKLSGYAKVANTDGDPLRLRAAPNSSASTITLLDPSTTVSVKQGPVVDKSQVAWYQVSVSGQTGWSMGQYLAQSSAPVQASSSVQAQVKPVQAPAKQAPAPAKQASAPPAPKPTAVPAPKPAQPPVSTRSGTSRGAQQAQAPKSSSLGQTIVNIAMRFNGYPYVFGGTTPAGFDCSGLVYYVVNHAGRGISRDMYSQLASGARVSSSALQPGDLLFFSNTYKPGLSHAGIYIGNGKFIHAENESTGVTIGALWSAYWAAHYTAAVRLP